MSHKSNEQDPPRTAARRNTANDALEESNRFFTTLAKVSPVGIFRTDAQGSCVYVNERWCKISGMPLVNALGAGWAQAIHPDDLEEVAKAWYTSAQARRKFIMEYRFQRPNGETRWVQGEAAAERDATGEVVGYVGTITDITHSKRAEENLRKSEERYRSLFESMLNGFAYCRMQYDDRNRPVDFIYLDVNEAFGRVTGLKNVVGKPVSEVIPGIREQNPELFEIYGRVVSTGIPEIFDLDLKLLGKWFAISVHSPEKDCFVAVFDDITERKKSEGRLRQSEEKLRAYLDNISDTIWLIDANMNMAYVSPSVTPLLGVLPDQLIGRPSALVIHPDDMGIITNAMCYVMEHPGEPHTIQYRVGHRDGRWIYVESTGVNLLGNPAINGVLVAMRDITERKNIEDELKQTKERYDLATAIGKVGTWDWNLVTDDLIWSDETFRLLGLMPGSVTPSYELFLGKVHPDDREFLNNSVQAALRDKTPYTLDCRIASGSGEELACHITGKVEFDAKDQPIRMLGTIHDITSRKAVEERLRQSEANQRAILNNSPYQTWLKDPEGRYLKVNKAFADHARLKDARQVIGKTDFDLWPIELAKKYRADDAEVMASRLQKRVEEPSLDGDEMHWVETFKTPVIDESGNVLGTAGFARDITERKQIEEQIRNLAFHDSLTQLPNRRLLNDRLEQTMAASKRSGLYSALMFLDLDNFKLLNDTYGHNVGDLLLVEAAHRISRCVREADTVARFGGDEFMVMLGELDGNKAESATQAATVAEKIRTVLSKPYVLKFKHEGKVEMTVEHHCTSSIGVVLFIGQQGSTEDIVKWADLAMYQAKNAGRNLIRFYE